MTQATGGSDAGWPSGYARDVLDETDSTLNEAERQFDTLTGPTWILALNQTQARGRRGKAWTHPRGNFAATLVMPLDEPPGHAALRSFVTALAVYDAFVMLCGRAEPFQLKWPNDVLLNGGKVAGILLESVQRKGRVAGLSIGIGVNLAEAPDPASLPPDAVRPVALAAETGALVAPGEFLSALAQTYAAHEASFRVLGFAPIRRLWLDRAARLGQEIVARTGTAETRGIFETVDDDGRLILRTGAGRQAIAAADVFL